MTSGDAGVFPSQQPGDFEAGAIGKVDVWALRVPREDETHELDFSMLDTAERQRMAAFVRTKDQRHYGYAHAALRTVLGARLGVAPGVLRFARGLCPCCGEPHGRPVLATEPTSLEFSLSHGGAMVLIALAATTVGVDVEQIPRINTVADISSQLHPAERAEIESAQLDRRAAVFARLWVRKEAYLKGLGTGLGRDLAADDVRGSLPGWYIADVPTDTGHAAAVAVRACGHCVVQVHHTLPRAAPRTYGSVPGGTRRAHLPE